MNQNIFIKLSNIVNIFNDFLIANTLYNLCKLIINFGRLKPKLATEPKQIHNWSFLENISLYLVICICFCFRRAFCKPYDYSCRDSKK